MMFNPMYSPPWFNQACGSCLKATWDHPNPECEKFVNEEKYWEMAKASNEFDPRQGGTNISSP